MKIKVNLNIFLFAILFFFTNQLEIYSLVMIFALIHELAHLLCGILLGLEATTLNVMPLGFSIEFETVIEDYNKKILKSNITSLKKIIIALAGPIINLIIIILGLIFKVENSIIYANMLLLIFNILPIYPLDGGRIMENVLKIFVGNKKAYKYTNLITNIFTIILTMISSILILAFKNIAIFLIVIIIWLMTIRENKRYNIYNKIYKTIDKNYNYL